MEGAEPEPQAAVNEEENAKLSIEWAPVAQMRLTVCGPVRSDRVMNTPETGYASATTPWRIGTGLRLRALLVIFLVAGVLLTGNYVRAGALPEDQAAVEEQLDRDVYAYFKLNGAGYVATQFGDRVIFDHLVLDPKPMGFPPEPRWQWSGDWTAIPVTDEPASAAVGRTRDAQVLFGQITDASIVSLEAETSTTSVTASVQAPGYGIVLDGLVGGVQQVRFLDASGEVVHVIEM